MNLAEKVAAHPYWYHKIELSDEVTTPGWAPIDADIYSLPEKMDGLRVLDVGAWDGYWTFECLKRGAKYVLAIDDFSDNVGILKDGAHAQEAWATFDLCREALGYGEEVCDRKEMSVYDVCEETVGRFDVVLFFGTIYHLRYPLMGLDKLASVCDGAIFIESAILDDYSPYRGGIGHGYDGQQYVSEFYGLKQYGNNQGNWWVPSLDNLCAQVESAGFGNIKRWKLKTQPRELKHCRGFVFGCKPDAKLVAAAQAQEDATPTKPLVKIAAAASVPRLGFFDNFSSIMGGILPTNIPLTALQGVYWGPTLERGMEKLIDDGYDGILTLDYDSLFTRRDVDELRRLMAYHPEADAIFAIQEGRGIGFPLMTIPSRSGRRIKSPKASIFEPDLTEAKTAHFGLTLFRVESLLKMQHPWFEAKPNYEGRWQDGRVDEDIGFWQHFAAAGLKVFQANRVHIGHMVLCVKWADGEFRPIFQEIGDYNEKGKPEQAWK